MSVNKVKQHLYSSFVYCKGSELLHKFYSSIWIVWKSHFNNQTILDILWCISVSFYFQFVLSSLIISPPLDWVNRISFFSMLCSKGVCSTSSLTKLGFFSSGAVVARLWSPLGGSRRLLEELHTPRCSQGSTGFALAWASKVSLGLVLISQICKRGKMEDHQFCKNV